MSESVWDQPWGRYANPTVIEEAYTSLNPSPSTSTRKSPMKLSQSSTSSWTTLLDDVFDDAKSSNTTHVGESPSSKMQRLSISTPTSELQIHRREDPASPTPTPKQIFVPGNTGHRFIDFFEAVQDSEFSSSDTEEEQIISPQSELTSLFPSSSGSSRTSSMSSGSHGIRPPAWRKHTLGYGESSISSNPTSPMKRSLTNRETDSSNDQSMIPPISKFRRTQSEVLPRHPPPKTANDVFASQPAPSTINRRSGLDIQIVAHSKPVQKMFDQHRIAWGVQFEIAKGVTRGSWTWQDVTEQKVKLLMGSNVDAACKVPAVILERSLKHPSDLKIWKEFDREQLAIVESGSWQRGLGVMGDFEGETDWHGGRIIQIARLFKQQNGDIRIQLEGLEYQRASTRFARFLGSRRILRVNVTSDLLYDEEKVRSFFLKKFVLCGRVFIPLRPKDSKVYLVEIREDHERSPNAKEGDDRRLSFEDIVKWHNPLSTNRKQPVRKWVTRFDLAFSISVPVLEFLEEDIYYIADEYVPGYTQETASAQHILTDGCGFMNRAALAGIAKLMRLEHMPTAVQGRIAGAKGVWMLHPEFQSVSESKPKIWIRTSQNKIKYGYGVKKDLKMTRAHLIFDLVAPNRLSYPSRLSMQTIVNLSHNGVPRGIFEKLMEDGIKDEFEKLTTWEGPNAMKIVLDAVAKVGNVGGMRLRREAAGIGRALGYGREWGSEEGFAEELGDDVDEDSTSGRNPHSLEPICLAEKVFELIAANFHPFHSPKLRDDLKALIKNKLESYVKSYHILNPQSCEAFIVPDPFGILDENQIYFRSWQPVRDTYLDSNPEVVSGQALIYRNPTRLPSDVQLVIAVDCYHSEFQNYRNVIICSTQGDRSLASKLAGGDYDGDTAVLTWKPEIVSAFHQPEFSDPPPDFLQKNFKKDVEQVADFLERIQSLHPNDAIRQFHGVFLLGLSNPKVGLYSRFHDNAVYAKGYDHPDSINLAYMFTTVLDSTKTGLQVEPAVFSKHRRTFDRVLPQCMPKSENSVPTSNMGSLHRGQHLPSFILDQLCEYGKKLFNQYMAQYDELCSQPSRVGDRHIVSVFEQARSQVQGSDGGIITRELDAIQKHIDECYQFWTQIHSMHSPDPICDKKQTKRIAKEKNKAIDALRQRFATGPEEVRLLQALGLVPKLKASCAFKKGENFGFAVAYRDVCEIKASASETLAPIARPFADILGVPASFARLYARDYDWCVV